MKFKTHKRFEFTQEQIAKVLDYNPETGIFTWKVHAGRAQPGKRAGSIVKDGYRIISIFECNCQESHLAWFITYGEWPAELVDHENHIVDDNRIGNLRKANYQQNCRNRKIVKTNKSGFKGVHFWKKGKGWWRAVIYINYKIKLIGQFDTPELAAKAYDKAAIENFGEFANLNFPIDRSSQTNNGHTLSLQK